VAEIIYENPIGDVLPERFLNYSVAVLQDRAIPNGFDGLKPIHRRVLMAMHDLKLGAKAPYRKCAKTIGEVLGKYHPHGDQSAYEALVGLAQTFNMRYPLVDGSGNFGSVNGDTAAAMRYTESRLSPYGELMLEGVEELSPTKRNFDDSADEPITLSSYFPNLLLNPTIGIAVGLQTKFAPHYARDVYTALIKSIEAEARGEVLGLEELIAIIKAPDFPSRAQIINGEAVKDIYRTGKGPVTLRSRYKLEKNSIVFYEIPYKVKPRDIVTKITALKLEDVVEVRDESSLDNPTRIVVELKKGTDSRRIVNVLYRKTDLQCNYNVNMVAIMDNKPCDQMNLKTVVDYYLTNLKGVHRRGLENQKRALEDKLFVINTLLKAIDLIEEIIRIVRNEDNPVKELQLQLGFTKEEAGYIYQIRISALSKANKLDLDAKKAMYEAELARLVELLGDTVKFLLDIAKRLTELRDSKIFKDDARLTEITNLGEEENGLDEKSFVKKEPIIVSYSSLGLLRVSKPNEYRVTGRGTMGSTTKLNEGEYLLQTMSISTHANLLLISDTGRAFILPAYRLLRDGKALGPKSVNSFVVLEKEKNEKIIMISSIPEEQEGLSVVFVTSNGLVKRISLEQLLKSRGSRLGSRAIGLERDANKQIVDRIAGAAIIRENAELCVFTSLGRGIRFNVDEPGKEVRCSGKTSRGVIALKLADEQKEKVVAATKLAEASSILLITSMGIGKRLNQKSLKQQKRGQVPILYMPRIKAVGEIVSAIAVSGLDNIMIITKQGQTLVTPLEGFSTVSRTAQGNIMINIKKEGDQVACMNTVVSESNQDSPPAVEQTSLF